MSINKNLFNFFSVTVFTAIVTILSIYFLTKKLDVEAFAIFGLLSSVTTFANGVISSSATFIFSRKILFKWFLEKKLNLKTMLIQQFGQKSICHG